MRSVIFLLVMLLGYFALGQTENSAPQEGHGIGVMAYQFQLKEFSIDTTGIYVGAQNIDCKGQVLNLMLEEPFGV